jgi:tetratricopeptide (TPR) repeat protein
MKNSIQRFILIAITGFLLIQCATTTPPPTEEIAHHTIVKDLYESGEYAQAADTAEVLTQDYPDESKIFYYLGLAEFQLGNFDQGVEAYTEADTLAGENARMDSLYSTVLTEKAEQFNAEEDYELAMQWAKQALEFDPYNQTARYEYHMAEGKQLYFQGSKWELWDAIVAFGKAEHAKPNDPMPYYFAAKSYHKKDDQDFENIISSYEKALKSNPSPELKNEIQSELEELRRRKKLYEDFWGN